MLESTLAQSNTTDPDAAPTAGGGAPVVVNNNTGSRNGSIVSATTTAATTTLDGGSPGPASDNDEEDSPSASSLETKIAQKGDEDEEGDSMCKKWVTPHTHKDHFIHLPQSYHKALTALLKPHVDLYPDGSAKPKSAPSYTVEVMMKKLVLMHPKKGAPFEFHPCHGLRYEPASLPKEIHYSDLAICHVQALGKDKRPDEWSPKLIVDVAKMCIEYNWLDTFALLIRNTDLIEHWSERAVQTQWYPLVHFACASKVPTVLSLVLDAYEKKARAFVDHYKTLGIDRSASKDEVRTAFNNKKILHAHTNPNDGEVLFDLFLSAYSTLSSTGRTAYDHELDWNQGLVKAEVNRTIDSTLGYFRPRHFTPMAYCALTNDTESAQILLDNGAEIDSDWSSDVALPGSGWRPNAPLPLAFDHGNLEMMQFLVFKGNVDPTTKDEHGHTMFKWLDWLDLDLDLDWQVPFIRPVPCMRFFLEQEKKRAPKGPSSATPRKFWEAATSGAVEVAKVLVEFGATTLTKPEDIEGLLAEKTLPGLLEYLFTKTDYPKVVKTSQDEWDEVLADLLNFSYGGMDLEVLSLILKFGAPTLSKVCWCSNVSGVRSTIPWWQFKASLDLLLEHYGKQLPEAMHGYTHWDDESLNFYLKWTDTISLTELVNILRDRFHDPAAAIQELSDERHPPALETGGGMPDDGPGPQEEAAPNNDDVRAMPHGSQKGDTTSL